MSQSSPIFGSHRPTEDFPVVQRTGMLFLRRMARFGVGVFGGVGERVYFIRDIFRALFHEWSTYGPLTFKQMRLIGVESLPLTVIVAAFIGSVIALQTRYQLFPGVQLSVVGLISRQMIILELGPLLTGLVLTGRVGARMTAEIGTMRVTEQIDALETLSYDPVAYLIVPRVLAGMFMLPLLVIFANFVGVTVAFITSIFATDAPDATLTELRFEFDASLPPGTFLVAGSASPLDAQPRDFPLIVDATSGAADSVKLSDN